MGDRMGSREAKGSSLKKSKKNPGCAVAKAKKTPKAVDTVLHSQAPPIPSDSVYFDCSAALLSRQFDRDRDRVLQRSQSDQVGSIVAWFADIEKQIQLVELCKQNKGFLYFVTGVHPDNIDRTNKKSHDGWMERVDEYGKKPECIGEKRPKKMTHGLGVSFYLYLTGILSGLNLNREMGSHFPQESILRASCAMAEKLLLPLVLHCSDAKSLDRAIEVLGEEGWTSSGDAKFSENGSKRVILYDAITACGGNAESIRLAVGKGFYCMLSAAGLMDPVEETKGKAIDCVASIPISKLLSCTDSPWKTPQNMTDAYLRTLRNEPSNLPFVNLAISQSLKKDPAELNHHLRMNAIAAFGLEFIPCGATDHIDREQVAPVAVAMAVSSAARHELIGFAQDTRESTAASGDLKEASQEALQPKVDQKMLGMSPSRHPLATTVDEEKPSAEESNCRPAEFVYGCVKCRAILFDQLSSFSHGLQSSRTVFAVGEEGLCQSVLFLQCAETGKLARPNTLEVRAETGTVECGECGAKLGKFSAGEAFCTCGAAVTGPVLRILTAKVDRFHSSMGQDELLALARREVEILDDRLEDLDIDTKRGVGKKGKKKSKLASLNKGNFSSFRNKSFVPNASRSALKKGGGQDMAREGEAPNQSGDEEADDSLRKEPMGIVEAGLELEEEEEFVSSD